MALNILMSSANRHVLDLVKSGRSFTYRTNNKGPRTDPCGIPDVTLCQFDSFPFTVTFCRLFVLSFFFEGSNSFRCFQSDREFIPDPRCSDRTNMCVHSYS